MQKFAKKISIVMAALFTLVTMLTAAPLTTKAATLPTKLDVKMIQDVQPTYKVGERMYFKVNVPSYSGKVEYRATLWDGSEKKIIEVFKTFPYYYAGWQPLGPSEFYVTWICEKPATYNITLYARPVGSKLPYAGYIKSSNFTVAAEEQVPQPATISSIDDLKATINEGDAYTLPAQVDAKMSDGSTKKVDVAWTPATVDTKKVGDTTFTGKVAGFDKGAKLTLTVKEVVLTAEVKATAANEMTVTFNKAVDTTKAAFEVKYGYVPQDVTVKFAADNKSATLTSANNFMAGDYTVTANGITKTVKVEAQKMVSFTITTSKITADANQAVKYAAVDQYGKTFDYAATNFQPVAWNVTDGTAVTINANVNAFVIPNAIAADKKIIVTLTHKTSGLSQTANFTVAAAVAVDSVVFGTPVPKTNEARIFINDATDKLVLPLTIKDQYGNDMTVTALLLGNDVTFISSNNNIVDPANFSVTDGKVYFRTGAKSGNVTITAISKKTGKTASVTFAVSDPAALASVALQQPAGLTVANEPVTVTYSAKDTLGADAKLTKVGDLVWFSTDPTIVDVTKDISVDAKGVLKVTPEKDGAVSVSAFLGGVKQAEISLTVQPAAVATKITKLSDTAITYFNKALGTYTYTVDDFVVVDQYNRVMDPDTLNGALTIALKDANATGYVGINGAAVTASNNKVGTVTLTATYAAAQSKDFTVTVIADSAVVNYSVKAFSNTLLKSVLENGDVAANYAKTFAIQYGLDASGNKVALSAADAADMTLTKSNGEVTINGLVVTATANSDAKTSVVAAWKKGVKIAEVTFTTSKNASSVTSIAYKEASYKVAVAGTVNLTTGITVKDQYGVTAALNGGTWFSSNNAIATVNNGVVTGVAAGEATITYVTSAGVFSSVKVVVE